MSSAAATDPTTSAPSGPKKKNNKKKKNANKNKDAAAKDENENVDDAPESPTDDTPGDDNDAKATSNGHVDTSTENGHAVQPAAESEASPDTAAKLEAMSKDREALRAEVEELRKQLESIQETHAAEVTKLKDELEESNTAKETAEEQYQTLLDRVEKIKETLSDRLKRDKADLEEANKRIEELETQNEQLQTTGTGNARLQEELQDAQRELTTLRSRSNLSTENWNKEKTELTKTVQRLKEEMEATANAMGEWEVLAMEERSIKENLSEKVTDLEDQITSLRQGYESATTERDSQTTLIDNLQNALREIQEARKKELRDMVESTEAQLQAHKKAVTEAESRSAEAEAAREELAKEVQRTAPFEKEVKEKNLHIGKLRHEAIILNDHLTKALRFLKKSKPEENVDRQVVTNHLLHFLTLDRSDAKRFQVLQVMAGYLNWTDEQREQAGLSRPGLSGSLRLPSSPFHRTPSSPSLSADLFTDPGPSAKDKETLSELWAGFLERSAQEGNPVETGTAGDRKLSVTSPTTEQRPQSRA